MNSWSFIPLVSLLVNTILTTYVFAYERNHPAHRAYFLLSLFLTAWLCFEFLLTTIVPDTWALLFLRIEILFWAPTGILFLRFVYILIGRQRDWLYRLTQIPPMAVIPVGVLTDLVVSGMTRHDWGVSIIGGPLYEWSTNLSIGIPFLICFYLIASCWRKTDNQSLKTQLMLIGFAALVPFIFGYTTVIALPLWFGIQSVEMLSPGLLFYSLFIFVAIRKRQFLALSVEDIATDLFKQMQEAVLILDQDKRILKMNDAARDVFGVSDLKEGEHLVTEFLMSYPSQESFQSFETVIEKPGRKMTLSVSQTNIEGENDKEGKLLIIKDVTDEKVAAEKILEMNRHLAEARDQALSASRAKSQFLANMSHELRTPLNAIIGYSEMAADELIEKNEQELAEDMGRIQSSGKHLLTLINEVLDLSKIEAGKMELEVSEFSIVDLVNETVEMIQPLMAKNRNQLILQVDDDLATMVADLLKSRQILFNLLSNASKFTSDGEVTLTVKQTGDTGAPAIRFEVMDNGIGMTREQQSHLFQEFYQGEAGETERYQGTGLGLAITRHFCEMMGGSIEVESRRGEGSRFTVTLPFNNVSTA